MGVIVLSKDSDHASLVRSLGLIGILALALDNVIGGGINYISVQVEGKVPGIGMYVPLVMLIGGIIAFFISINYSYLGSAMPRAGGEYIWVSRGWNGFIGFLSSFSFWVAEATAAAAVVFIDPKFFGTAFNQIGLTSAGSWVDSTVGTLIIGLAIIWVIWLFHMISVKTVGWASIILMIMMLAGGFFIVLYGFIGNPHDYASILKTNGINMQKYILLSKKTIPASSASTIPKALFLLFFAFIGFTAMSQASGETKNPKKTLLIVFPLAIGIITTYFILYASAVFHTVPWRYVAGQMIAGHTSLINGPALLGYMMPAGLAVFVTLMVAAALFNDLPPILQALTRLFYSWGVDGILPRSLGKANKRGVPATSITINTVIITIFFLLTVWFGWANEISVTVAAAMFMYITVGIASLTFLKHAPKLEKKSGMHKNVFVIISAVITIIASSWLFIQGIISNIHEAWYLQSIIQWLISMGIAVIIYYYGAKNVKAKEGISLNTKFKELPSEED